MSELCDRLSGEELLRWELLESVEPWGSRRADLRLAILCWTIYSCHCTRAPSFSKVVRQIDEMLGAEQADQSDEQLGKMFDIIAG